MVTGCQNAGAIKRWNFWSKPIEIFPTKKKRLFTLDPLNRHEKSYFFHQQLTISLCYFIYGWARYLAEWTWFRNNIAELLEEAKLNADSFNGKRTVEGISFRTTLLSFANVCGSVFFFSRIFSISQKSWDKIMPNTIDKIIITKLPEPLTLQGLEMWRPRR